MSPLRRPARQIAATALVVAGLILPTLGVIVHAWRINQPSHVVDHEKALSGLLGLHVSITRVEYPRPGESVFHDLVLRREEGTGPTSRLAELARLPRVRLITEDHAAHLHTDELTLTISSPSELADLLASLAPRAVAGVARINLIAGEVQFAPNLPTDTPVASLRDLAATLQAHPGSTTLSASSRWGDQPDAPRLELVASRSPTPEGTLTDIQFQIDDDEAPVAVLQPWVDPHAWFGSEATVRGLARFERTDREPWRARFSGVIRSIDLQQLVAGRFPNAALSGRADLTLTEALWASLPRGQGFGWTTARGRLEARDGSISGSLLQALITHLQFRPTDAIDLDADSVPYARLGLDFELDHNGQLRLLGSVSAAPTPNTVALASNGSSPLLLAPPAAASVRGLWKTLFPTPTDTLIPATAESGGLLRHLPLPPAGSTPVRAN
ncbi:MAG: hypothetical protein KatS3mg108_3244 [Isosphaeraceae bacterium]|jgi:hypothetical protein|nr:MAG: hypothetical protein KatS3mg108_3244 [Isosphaeraceae bacterium]